MQTKRFHWIALAFVVGGAFLLLGFFGREVYRQAPPIPGRIVSTSGAELATRDQILDGQQVWQSAGGQQLGSIWGHGAYQAPDWSADWVHRECVALLDAWSRAEHGSAYVDLAPGPKAELEGRLKHALRTNTYDATSDTLTIADDRAQA